MFPFLLQCHISYSIFYRLHRYGNEQNVFTCVCVHKRESIRNKSTTSEHSHPIFFQDIFFSIYQHVCMCSVYQVILLKCGSWPDFIPNGNISQKSCRQSQESGRHLTYSGHGTYQNNSISPVKWALDFKDEIGAWKTSKWIPFNQNKTELKATTTNHHL